MLLEGVGAMIQPVALSEIVVSAAPSVDSRDDLPRHDDVCKQNSGHDQ